MHHSVFGKKLSRTHNERQSLFRNLMKSMIIHGAVKTSKAKALAVRSDLEKLITKAKKGTDVMRREVLSTLSDRQLGDQLIEMAKTQFAGRNSGYTRIVKLGARSGDATEMVLLAFVDQKIETEVIAPKPEKKAVKIEEKETKSEKKVTRTKTKK